MSACIFVFFLAGALVCAGSERGLAGVSPLGVSIWDPVQAPPEDWDVVGTRLNFGYGNCESLYGLDLGLGLNAIRDRTWGIHLAGIGNVSSKDLSGPLETQEACGLPSAPGESVNESNKQDVLFNPPRSRDRLVEFTRIDLCITPREVVASCRALDTRKWFDPNGDIRVSHRLEMTDVDDC